MTEQGSTDSPATYWDRVHNGRQPTDVSWYEPTPDSSIAILDELRVDLLGPIIDVGAGSSGLAAALLERGFGDITALDVSDVALQIGRDTLGTRAGEIDWITADLLTWKPSRRYAAWHDRAVFHFLTEEDQRERYRRLLAEALTPGAIVVVATFAADGPHQCSGLPTSRYDPAELAAELGPDIVPQVARRIGHRTPTGTVQPFTWLGGRYLRQ